MRRLLIANVMSMVLFFFTSMVLADNSNEDKPTDKQSQTIENISRQSSTDTSISQNNKTTTKKTISLWGSEENGSAQSADSQEDETPVKETISLWD